MSAFDSRSSRWSIFTAALVVLMSVIPFCSPVAAQNHSSSSASGPERGLAAYYSRHLNWRRTASGERYNPNALTAAHNTLPFGTHVRITSVKNNRSVVARINDRGPTTAGRITDVSRRVARRLRFLGAGLTEAALEVVQESQSR
jgi:rare lipoprotein A